MQKQYTFEEAKAKLEYYCSYQERCHEEVMQKLQSYQIYGEHADAIAVHLIDNNYLNEERFARSFARGKFRIKSWGRTRITRELKVRNISGFIIKEALTEIDNEDYIKTFNSLADKQWSESREKNRFTKKRKLMDFLLRKGYESTLIYEKLNELENSQR